MSIFKIMAPIAAATGVAVLALPAVAGPPTSRVAISGVDSAVVRVHDGPRHDRRHYRYSDRDDVVVEAPFTYVETRGRRTWVDAPFTAVRVHPRGVWVRAPFVNLYVPR